MVDPRNEKKYLRTQMLARRKKITDNGLSEELTGLFLKHDAFAQVACLSAYWPMAGEIDVRALMVELSKRGQNVCLPAVKQKEAPLVFLHWQPGDVLVKGAFATQQPDWAKEECHPDLMLVPLLAFDRYGGRLGFGGGFYDRTLAARKDVIAVGIAFDEQEVAHVPMETFDQRMDWIVTPSRVIEITD